MGCVIDFWCCDFYCNYNKKNLSGRNGLLLMFNEFILFNYVLL